MLLFIKKGIINFIFCKYDSNSYQNVIYLYILVNIFGDIFIYIYKSFIQEFEIKMLYIII